jgi:uncharacterized protein YdcH (DUF465 family)
MDRYLWKFHWDCRRNGQLTTLFVATEDEVKSLYGKEVNFGEVLGKHSEVSGTIEENEITKMELDSETVEKVCAILGTTWSGYNLFEYVMHHCEKCECSYPGYDWDTKNDKCYYCKDEEE